MTPPRSPQALANSARLSREAKRRRTGICVDCGGVTRYAGYGVNNGVAERCALCGRRYVARMQRGRGPYIAAVLATMENGPRHYADILRETNPPHQAQAYITLRRLISYGMVERVARGVYQRTEAKGDPR